MRFYELVVFLIFFPFFWFCRLFNDINIIFSSYLLFKCIISWWVIDMYFYAKRSCCFENRMFYPFILLCALQTKSFLLTFFSISAVLFISYVTSSFKKISQNKTTNYFWYRSKKCFSTLFSIAFICFCPWFQSFLFVFPKIFLKKNK